MFEASHYQHPQLHRNQADSHQAGEGTGCLKEEFVYKHLIFPITFIKVGKGSKAASFFWDVKASPEAATSSDSTTN